MKESPDSEKGKEVAVSSDPLRRTSKVSKASISKNSLHNKTEAKGMSELLSAQEWRELRAEIRKTASTYQEAVTRAMEASADAAAACERANTLKRERCDAVREGNRVYRKKLAAEDMMFEQSKCSYL
jgi:hypothetical protein